MKDKLTPEQRERLYKKIIDATKRIADAFDKLNARLEAERAKHPPSCDIHNYHLINNPKADCTCGRNDAKKLHRAMRK